MPELAHLDRKTDPDTIWARLDEDGGVIVDDFYSGDAPRVAANGAAARLLDGVRPV